MLLPEGNYIGRVKNYIVKEIQTGENKGKPYILIAFVLNDHPEGTFYYRGGFVGRSLPFTCDALFTCGIYAEDIEKLADRDDLLDTKREVSLKIVQTPDDKMQLRNEVRFVNPIGGAAFANGMPADKYKFWAGTLNLKSEFLAHTAKFGPAPVKPDPTNDIPF